MKKIKIAGYYIPIELEDDLLVPTAMRLGEYSPFEQKIRIATGLTEQQKKETIIHEILEAVNSIYELGLNHDEQLCKLSVAIHQMCVDNPEQLSALLACDCSKS